MTTIRDFRDIDKLTPSDFERFVGSVLEAAGWQDLSYTQLNQNSLHGDGGVDIFAKKNGKTFAIEVKQRAIDVPVGVTALNQLVTGAKLANTKRMILVTNSYFTTDVTARAFKLGVELIDRGDLKTLWSSHRSEIGARIRPRQYQQAIINEVLEAADGGRSSFLIEMAPGLGKTYLAAFLIRTLLHKYEDISGVKVLFLAHQVELLVQAARSFKNVLGLGQHSYSACFDGSTLEDTDIVLATFQTLHQSLSDIGISRFSIIVIDEAHHIAAPTYLKVLGRLQPKFLVGLTATPFRADEEDIFRYFGGTSGHIGKLDLAWGIRQRHLALPKYEVLLDDIDEEQLRKLDLGMGIADLDRKLFLHKKDEEVVRIITDRVKQVIDGPPRGIVFCRSIVHIRQVMQFFPAGSATTLHSKMSEDERRSNLRRFREGEFSYILVRDLFNEGVDVPEVNLLVFLRFTRSRTIWLQQLGRGLRKTDNKTFVHVLDFVGSLDRLYEIRGFAASIKSASLNRDDYTATDGEDPDIQYDHTFEVHYDSQAAMIFELLEKFEYRIRPRGPILESLRSYIQINDEIPSIDQIYDAIGGASVDQVVTLFGSYVGLLRAALGSEEIDSLLQAKCEGVVREHHFRYNLVPTAAAVSLKLAHDLLPFATASEIEPFVQRVAKSLSVPAILSAPSPLVPESSKPTNQDRSEESLLPFIEKYSSDVFGSQDLDLISAEDRQTMKALCPSDFKLLKLLRRHRERG